MQGGEESGRPGLGYKELRGISAPGQQGWRLRAEKPSVCSGEEESSTVPGSSLGLFKELTCLLWRQDYF